ncbi:beta-barrel assembly-enhancing protease [Natronospira bacteriovora]|uniref:M48 family metalloprotease n=1 Tax=Natronospira bacteriovora TaxID=3069753 RepID=A0ABU0W355_9GAMM|nr:M48 family metalloprotease [Natronospira sp. AB-CW4]MDQ2068431.1 M48 family metalloprotease [Natronospira sp. AB-CW4]
MRLIYRLTAILFAMSLGWLALAGPTVAQGFDTNRLPDLGDASSTVFSPSEQASIGRDIVRQIRASGAILEDPDLEEYIQGLGQHLAAHSSRPGDHFDFFIIRSPAINAFALPGGYIGINAGLILAADNESELAGVVAHEIAHVTQRHIARQIDAMRGTGLAALGAMLGAILIAANTGHADAAMATAISAQALTLQRQINFTRAHEYEADRIGIKMMAEAGFDPEGMATFFEKLQRRTQYSAGQGVPEYLRTHPLTTARITEARNRARDLRSEDHESSRRFYLMRERLNAMISASGGREVIALNPARSPMDIGFTADLDVYRQAVTAQVRGRHEEAARLFGSLRRKSPDIISYYIGEAESLLASGRETEALELYQSASALFPRNPSLSESHALSLLGAGEAQQAHDKLSAMVRRQDVPARYHRHLAQAASDLGNEAESHFHMAGFHLVQGDVYSAMIQMRLALGYPIADSRQLAQFNERMTRINMKWERLPRDVQQAQRPGQ